MQRKSFTPDDPALPMNYPGFVFRTLREDGYAAEALLAGTDLDETRLGDPHFRCGFQPLKRLFLNAMAQTGDAHLGVALALRFQPTYVGLPSYTAMNAATFRDGLDILERFFHLTFPAFELRLMEGQGEMPGGEAVLRLRSKFPFTEIEYFGLSSAVVAINGLMKAMLAADAVARRAELTIGAPDGWATIEEKLGFPVQFGAAENRIVFPAELLTRPLPGSDPINHVRLRGLCEQFAADMAFETTPVTEVVAFLDAAPCLNVTLPEVAAGLGYSERGLRRQLDRSGTSYRRLIDEVRARRARDLLAATTLPVKAIAGTLGFDSSSNFARSFRRWTGVSPNAFRESAQGRDAAGRK